MEETAGGTGTQDPGIGASTRTVLLATDGSLASVAATLRAIDIARTSGADLHVVHVTTAESGLQVEFGESGVESLEAHPVDGMEAARYLADHASVPTHMHELRGPVVETILEAARRVDAETIVMGETGPRAFAQSGPGSVAAAVRDRCPNREVMIVAGHASEVVPVIREIFAADSAALPGAASADPDVDWSAMVREPAFRQLLAMKWRFIVPVIAVSLAAYLVVNLLAGYARGFMSQSVSGAFSVGYVLIVGLYVMTWAISVAYVRVANGRFDSKAAEAVADLERWKQNR